MPVVVRLSRFGGVPLHHVQVGQPKSVERLHDVAESRIGVGVGHGVEGVGRRQADPDPVPAPDFHNRLGHFEQQTRAVGDWAAIDVVAPIAAVAQELVEQIAVGAMHLDTVEAGAQGVACGGAVLVDDVGDFAERQRARRHEIARAVEGVRMALRPNRRGRDRQGAAGLQARVRDAPDVPKLQKDPAIAGMDRLGHAAPSRNLLGAMNAGRVGIAQALGRNLRRLGDDQPGRSALDVVGGIELLRHVSRPGPIAGQGRHDHAVGEAVGAELEGCEQVRMPGVGVGHDACSLFGNVSDHSVQNWVKNIRSAPQKMLRLSSGESPSHMARSAWSGRSWPVLGWTSTVRPSRLSASQGTSSANNSVSKAIW